MLQLNKRFVAFVVAAALAVCAASDRAKADLIVGDSFESYAVGNLAGNNGGLSGGSGAWTGAYTAINANNDANVASGGLAYSNGAINISGGAQHVVLTDLAGPVSGATAIRDGIVVRAFTPQTNTVYFSFLFQTTATVGDDFLQFSLNDDADQFNSASAMMATSYQSRISGNSTTTTASSSTSPVVGMPMLLVGKVSKTNGSTTYNRIDLFVNPSTLSESLASVISTSESFATTLSNFTIRTARIESGDTYLFDALRVGTTWGDVVSPINYAAVPEPSSFALAAIGAAGLAWRRRRRLPAAGVTTTEASVS